MFVHKYQLRHLLRPQQYFSDEQYQLELKRLFLPGWHFVTTKADLSRPGDFLTLDLFGRPLLLRNVDGDIRAFLNVCSHRHCRLTNAAKGSDPRFRCQYHGWEYTPEGRTARIPDAGCFRPFDRENARLHQFAVESCSGLVFVRLADEGPTLRDYLGPLYTAFEEFAPPYRQAWKWEADYPANWKVIVENSLESYHIPCLHVKTFGDFPKEETCTHLLNERFTSFHTPEPPSWASKVQNWFVRRLGVTLTNIYTHHHLHPNLILTSLDVHRMAQLIVPTSPTTTRHIVWTYALRGNKQGLSARLISWILAKLVSKVAGMILKEDTRIFPEVQRGLQASVHPGVIGTREERIFVFQQYVAKACGVEPPPDRGRESLV